MAERVQERSAAVQLKGDAACRGRPRKLRNQATSVKTLGSIDSVAAPERIQLSRAKGWRMPPNTRKVDRATLHGNPFPVEKYGREQAVRLFRDWLTGAISDQEIRKSFPPLLANHLVAKRQWMLEGMPHLKGKNLACWCPVPEVGKPDLCHAAVLMELANRQR